MSDDIQEVVAEHAPETTEKLAEFADDYLTGLKTRFGFLGLAVGLAVGAAGGYFFTKRKVEAAANERADAEIADMREHYLAKAMSLEAQAGKTDLADLVKERGYETPEPTISTAPPMAVQPPGAVMAAEDEMAGEPPDDAAMAEDDVEGPNGIKIKGEAAVRNIFREHGNGRVASPEWNAAEERKRRSPDRPYVIHYDERHEMDGYSDVSYTYYAADDVLCNERDEVVDPDRERDDLVGEANLERFGHGCDDQNTVFIRNDNLEMMIEINRSPNSFAEEVHGFKHESWDRGNLERMRRRESNEEN